MLLAALEAPVAGGPRDELSLQNLAPPPRFVAVTTAGVLELEKLRPADVLAQVRLGALSCCCSVFCAVMTAGTLELEKLPPGRRAGTSGVGPLYPCGVCGKVLSVIVMVVLYVYRPACRPSPAQLLEERSSAKLEQFFKSYGPAEAAAMCVLLATSTPPTVPAAVVQVRCSGDVCVFGVGWGGEQISI